MVSTVFTSGTDLNSKCVSVRIVGPTLVMSNICVVRRVSLRRPRTMWAAMTLFAKSAVGAMVSRRPRCVFAKVRLNTIGIMLAAVPNGS